VIKIKVNRIEPKHIKGKELDILFFGDMHLGSKDCYLEKVKKQIEWIKNKKNVVVILMGDTVNCALKNSVGAGSYDDIVTPAKQIEQAVELFTPIKDKIYGLHNGNHGNRIYNETTISPEQIIAKSLGVPYLGDTCFHYLRFGSQTYILFTAHGSTGSSTVSGALNACMKYSRFVTADVYAMGHSHNLASISQVNYEISKKDKTIIEKKRHFILTGGYLKWVGSYAEHKNYSPLKIGSAKATIRGDRYDIHIRT
jgi:predicted phosphodiesterase